MNIPDLAKGSAIWVRWFDSSLLAPAWMYDEFESHPKEIQSIGFIANFGDAAITLTCAQSDSGGLLSPFTIPLCCVQEYKYLDI